MGPRVSVAMVFHVGVLAVILAALGIAVLTTPVAAVSVHLDHNGGPLDRPTLPSFLQGQPEERQAHVYGPDVRFAPHTASGEGLYAATVGVPASFTIHLVGDFGTPPLGQWNADGHHFVYVWIANANQIFIAEVVDNGDGTLTATYESSFPGQYAVHIEEVVLSNHDEGLPLVGSPFALTVSGDSALDVNSLPVCGTQQEDTKNAFWRPGTWVSSNIASAKHGVARDGWVFQPKSCVYDMFSYEDLMLLAGLEEPTWLLVLGGSVQRGVFLTLVDMVLARGQKDDMDTSILAKCWGYAEIRVGNLRLTYQDLRLYRYSLGGGEDATVCNNEKLESGSTAMYLQSGKHFLEWVVFRDRTDWPSAILAPSHLVDREGYSNNAIEVVMDALPADWRGSLIMADHMSGLGYHWTQANPTMTTMADVGLVYHQILPTSDHGVGRMASYEDRDPRVTFMSVFPMYQAKLYENQETTPGQRHYGGSIHYHFMSSNYSVGAYSGAKMIHSSITEMIANIIIGKAVGTKAMLYESAATKAGATTPGVSIGDTFEMCTDCPSEMLPFHVQPKPEPECLTLHALPGNAPMGHVWDNELCPPWCLATDPVSQTPTEAGPVDVRVCPIHATGP